MFNVNVNEKKMIDKRDDHLFLWKEKTEIESTLY